MLVSAAAFGVLIGLVRHLADTGMPVLVMQFWRNLFAALIFLPWFLRVGLAGIRSHRLGLYVTRSVSLTLSSVAMFFAVTMMPVAEMTALSFTTPLFAAILAVFVLGERVGPRRWTALATGFAGVLLMLRPGLSVIDVGAFIVFFSAFTFAVVVVTGKMLAATEAPETIVFYLAVISVPLSFFPALAVWQWPTAGQVIWLIALGLASNINMYGISKALQAGEASLSQTFDFFRLPMTALVGFVFFAEVPDIWIWAGAIVILSSAVYIARREEAWRRRQPQQSAPPGDRG